MIAASLKGWSIQTSIKNFQKYLKSLPKFKLSLSDMEFGQKFQSGEVRVI